MVAQREVRAGIWCELTGAKRCPGSASYRTWRDGPRWVAWAQGGVGQHRSRTTSRATSLVRRLERCGLEAIGGSCRRNWLADIILQGTGDAVGFGVEVEHGRFEAVVTQDDLQVAYQGAALEGMGCERVAQAVRSESLQMSPKSGQVDGSLDITFVAAPAHESLAARVAADPTGGEEPGPAFGASRIRVFLGQESGQGYREVVGPIQLGLSFGQSQLAFQRLGQALRKEHDPAFTAFGLDTRRPQAYRRCTIRRVG